MSYDTKYKRFVVMTLTSTSMVSFTLDPNVAVLLLTMCIHASNCYFSLCEANVTR